MEQLLNQILDQLRGSWRFRWWALGVAWVTAMIGWAVVYALPNEYAAEARVYVDTDTALRPLLRGLAVQSDVMSNVNMMARVMLSRPNLENVARETDLHLRAKTPEDMELLVEEMREEIRIQGGLRDNIYTISYSDYDRAKAEKVVKQLLDTFVEDTLVATRSDASSAQNFLAEELARYETRLNDADAALAEFKRRNIGLMPGEGRDVYSRLQSAMMSIEQTRSELAVAVNKRNALRRQLSGSNGSGSNGSAAEEPTSLTAIDLKIQEHQATLDQLLLRYTRKHPDVEMLEGMIEQLQDQKTAIIASLEESGVSGLGQDNPVYQSIRIALSEAEVAVTTLQSQLGQYQRRADELRNKLEAIPEVEAELTRLTRDYQVTKRQYDELLKRLESARLSEKADVSSDDVKFRIIDPPAAPLEPTSPNRPLLLAFVFVLSLGAGGSLAFLFNQISPVFTDAAQLRELMGRPVLGSIQVVRSAAEVLHRRVQLASWVAGMVGLTLVFGVVLLLHGPGSRFARLIIERGLL